MPPARPFQTHGADRAPKLPRWSEVTELKDYEKRKNVWEELTFAVQIKKSMDLQET